MIRRAGKWANPNVPKNDWVCIDLIDHGEINAICQFCEYKPIRYAYLLVHASYPGQLWVGRICGRQVGLSVAETSALRHAANRLGKWMTEGWTQDLYGSWGRRPEGGLSVSVDRRGPDSWSFTIRRSTGVVCEQGGLASLFDAQRKSLLAFCYEKCGATKTPSVTFDPEQDFTTSGSNYDDDDYSEEWSYGK